jgi:DNA-directed RNA polymerase subunit RPC12/RpoP
MNLLKQNFLKLLLVITSLFFVSMDVFARVGGAGGEKKEEMLIKPTGGISKLTIPGLIGLVVVLIIYLIIRKRLGLGSGSGSKSSLMTGLKGAMSGGGIGGALSAVIAKDFTGTSTGGNKLFPDGLSEEKVSTSFLALQAAWEAQDLSKVRKWMSDGVYQRFTAQFIMMKQLTQRNTLSNVKIKDVSVMDIRTDGAYQSADISITFSMDDRFVSEKYPELNESYKGDSDTEIWTFIKRKDAAVSVQNDLFLSNNCPNCGSVLELQLGEVSRCSNCKTLTNNAAFDWVLNEITQDEDYKSGNDLLGDSRLKELVKNDSHFAIQRMEDIASNVFMQVMEVWSGATNKKLARFSDEGVATRILSQKQQQGEFVFDRLYLKEVTMQSYAIQNAQLQLSFRLTANYQRVQLGKKLTKLDPSIAEHTFKMILSKNTAALSTPEKDIAFSYECANCGAPYEDTTHHTCTYCDALVVDPSKNWVLTEFEQVK